MRRNYTGVTHSARRLLAILPMLCACRTSTSKDDSGAPAESLWTAMRQSAPSLQVELAVEAAAPAKGEPVAFTGGGPIICAHRHEADLACFGWRMPIGKTAAKPKIVFSAGYGVADFMPVALVGVRDTEVYTTALSRCFVGPRHDVRCTDGYGYVVDADVGAATQLSPGAYDCAVRPAGGAECWGQEVCLREGDGDDKYATFDVRKLEVPGLDDPIQIEGESFTVCALDRDGEVYCHGYRGRGRRCHVDGWERVPKLERAVEIATVESTGCAIDESGLVSCWGPEVNGHSGVKVEGTERLRDPVALTQVSPAVRLRSYDTGGCALRANGEIWCWGPMMKHTGDRVTPQRIDLPPAIDVIVGKHMGCALLPDHSVRCFGVKAEVWLRERHEFREGPLPFEGKEPWVNAPAYVLEKPPKRTEPGGDR